MRVQYTSLLPLSLFAFIWAGESFAQTRADQEDFFESRIRPVLAKACFECHAGGKRSQGLRVDSRWALLEGGDSGPAIVPGQPDASLLVQSISRSHGKLSTPPHKPLGKQEVADFRRWIQEGAVWPELSKRQDGQPHWAFEPRKTNELPKAISGWSDHPIDRLVAEVWRRHNLKPVQPASPRVLVRRLYYDLIGLPPTPEEVDAFEKESLRTPPSAFSNLIDRLLASPEYGERWGRHWMDVARYADTAGDNADYPVPEVRLYRDYIIDAFNADMPFDQFVQEQLAGDILARKNPSDRYGEQVIATGYLALSNRYGTRPFEHWHLTLEDTIDTVGRSVLGLTLKCARCHDHKFEPVTSEDYYALYGIFDSTQYPWAGGEEFKTFRRHRQHFVPISPDDQAAPKLAVFQARVDEIAEYILQLEGQLETADDRLKFALHMQLDWLRTEHSDMLRPGLPPDLPGAYAVKEGEPHDVQLQEGGDPKEVGEKIARNSIKYFSEDDLSIPQGESGRLQLAQWMTRPDHPLTARVMVNRIWLHHFGRGIVATPSNFGISGAEPTHPQLLDYLAERFIEGGWSIKQMHRLILTSNTWQLSSAENPHSSEIDPDNKFYWRHDRRRLDAEAIRDTMLLVSGELNRDRPLVHPFPPIKDWQWTQHKQFKDCYESRHRSVYLMTQRIQRHPFLALFDGPDTNTTTGLRTSSTVTPQSLYFMNSPEMVQIADSSAGRLLADARNPDERIDLAYQLCYARSPTNEERIRDKDYIEDFQEELRIGQDSVENPEHKAWASYAKILLSSSEFSYLD